jgi:hypothetical protein
LARRSTIRCKRIGEVGPTFVPGLNYIADEPKNKGHLPALSSATNTNLLKEKEDKNEIFWKNKALARGRD